MYPSSVFDADQPSVTFEHPVWTETDIFSKELTDSILTENFGTDATNSYNNAPSELLFDIESIAASNGDGIISDTLDLVTTVENENRFVASNGSDQFIFHSESEDGSRPCVYNIGSSGNIHNNGPNSYEFIPETLCTLDTFFELDLLSECLNIGDSEIDSRSISSVNEDVNNEYIDITQTGMYTGAISNNVNGNCWPSVDYANAKRRSLLYDKNEFVKLSSSSSSNNRINRDRPKTRAKTSASKPYSITASSQSDHQANDQRTYRCPVLSCDKTYLKASHLRSHVRRHTGVKPFACDWNGCEWRFSRSDELARHKRSHSGIKPYACDMCEKAFSRSDHLSKHAKVHMKKMAMYGTPVITKKCNYKYLSTNMLHMN